MKIISSNVEKINRKACENSLLMISIRKVALWNKNVKTILQEELTITPDNICIVKS
jgi:hypothetical protein